jgi:hypothetical protein
MKIWLGNQIGLPLHPSLKMQPAVPFTLGLPGVRSAGSPSGRATGSESRRKGASKQRAC